MKPYKIYCNGELIKVEGNKISAEKYVEYLKTLPEYANKKFCIVV